MTKKSKNTKAPKGKKKSSGSSLVSVMREGKPLSIELFRRHAWFILIAVVVVLALIGQRYSNQSKMQQIKRLENELATCRSEQVSAKAAYMSLIRENEMRRLLRSHHLDLDYQEQPPFSLSE